LPEATAVRRGAVFFVSPPIARRVVLEITERASLSGVDGLAAKLARLRKLGFRVAVDDLDTGYAGLQTFTPNRARIHHAGYVLGAGVDTSERKQSVIRAMNRLREKRSFDPRPDRGGGARG